MNEKLALCLEPKHGGRPWKQATRSWNTLASFKGVEGFTMHKEDVLECARTVEWKYAVIAVKDCRNANSIHEILQMPRRMSCECMYCDLLLVQKLGATRAFFSRRAEASQRTPRSSTGHTKLFERDGKGRRSITKSFEEEDALRT